MKTKFYFKFLPILTLTILTFFACETEPFGGNELTQQQLSAKELFKVNYSLEDFEDESGHITNNIEVDWDNYETKIFQENEWYEFQINQKKPMSYEGNGEIKGQSFTLLANKNEEGYKFYINKMLSFQNDKEFTYFGLQEKLYGGMVYLYNLKGELEHLIHYEKGNPMHNVESIKINSDITEKLGLVSRGGCWEKGNTARCDDALSCGIQVGGGGSSNGSCGGGGTSGGTGWTPVTTYHYTDWYNNNGDSWSYNGTTYDGHTTEWVWISGNGQNNSVTSWSYAETSGSGPNFDGYQSGEVNYMDNAPRGAEKADIIIYDSSLKTNPCVKGVVQKLVNLDDNLLKSTIGKFVDDPNFDLRIKIGNCRTTDEACTDGTKVNQTGEIIITVENTNQSNVGVAALLIHEGIHAELYRYISQYRHGVNPNDKREVFRWYKYYAEYYGDVFSHPHQGKNEIDHIYMTQYYIQPIANALRKFDNNKYPLNYYMDFAWDGLRQWVPSGSSNQYDPSLANLRNVVESNSVKCY